MQQDDQDGVAVPSRSADVGGSRFAGEPGLEADAARIVGEQLVVIGQRDELTVATGEGAVRRPDDRGEHRIPQHSPADQCQVVCRGMLLRRIESGRVDRDGVVGTEVAGLCGHE